VFVAYRHVDLNIEYRTRSDKQKKERKVPICPASHQIALLLLFIRPSSFLVRPPLLQQGDILLLRN